jgi:hypothetical protein
MAIVVLAADRDVERAGRDRAAIDRHAIADDTAVAEQVSPRVASEPRAQPLLALGCGERRLFAIVEVVLRGPDDLVVLVALAGDHDDVAGRGLGDRGPDRCAAIDVDEERLGHRR